VDRKFFHAFGGELGEEPYPVFRGEGTKLGYQDCGSWTLMKSTPLERRKAAWLYAQFVISKTVSLKKTHVGLSPTGESDLWDKSFTERAPKLGGLVEFYRNPARVQWTPTGTNVADYPKLAQLWWQNVADAVTGDKTPQEAMDSLAMQQDKVMERIERSGMQGEFGPKLNKEHDPSYWLNLPGSPKPKLANEKPQGMTVDYDELVKSWAATKH
jgi:glycerol transport system substrate-binding protein